MLMDSFMYSPTIPPIPETSQRTENALDKIEPGVDIETGYVITFETFFSSVRFVD